MSSGVIVQEGAPRDIYLQPKSKFVANFIGSTNQLNGQVSKTSLYLNGLLNGETREYFPNGKLRMSSIYKDDVLHGEVKTFGEDGKLKQTVRYQEGKPIAAAPPVAKSKR